MGIHPKDAAWKVSAGFADYFVAFVRKEILPHVAEAARKFGSKAVIDDADTSFVGIQTHPANYWVTVHLAGAVSGEMKFHLSVMADVETPVLKEIVDASTNGSVIGEKFAKAMTAHQAKAEKNLADNPFAADPEYVREHLLGRK